MQSRFVVRPNTVDKSLRSASRGRAFGNDAANKLGMRLVLYAKYLFRR